MKKVQLIIMMLLMIIATISCNDSTKNPTKEEVEVIFLKKGSDFISNQIDKDKNLLDLSKIEIDTFVILSTQGLEYSKMQPLIIKTQKQGVLTQELLDIDKKFGLGMSVITSNTFDEFKLLTDSLNNWEGKAQKMNDSDTLGYSVSYSCDFLLKDGSHAKNTLIFVNFDTDHDIRKEWNSIFK